MPRVKKDPDYGQKPSSFQNWRTAIEISTKTLTSKIAAKDYAISRGTLSTVIETMETTFALFASRHPHRSSGQSRNQCSIVRPSSSLSTPLRMRFCNTVQTADSTRKHASGIRCGGERCS